MALEELPNAIPDAIPDKKLVAVVGLTFMAGMLAGILLEKYGCVSCITKCCRKGCCRANMD